MTELVPVTAEDIAGFSTGAQNEEEGYDWLGLARAGAQGLFGLGDEITALARRFGSDLS